MTGSATRLPLRIPELGPYLGKLVTGTGREPGGLDLAPARYQLVTRLFDHAGEARRLAANGERAAAISALARASWLAAWEETVAYVAELLWTRTVERLSREADAVDMPASIRAAVFPGVTDRRALTARLGSAGTVLIPVLDEIERRGTDAFDATALERVAMEAWLAALRTAARRLEAAWLELESQVEAEAAWIGPLAERVAGWRKPLWPVWVTGAAVAAAALWLGLMLGGLAPTPAWLQPLIRALSG